MQTINSLPLKERLRLQVEHGGNLVVKGFQGQGGARVIGEVAIDQRERETCIEARGSLVLSVPDHLPLYLEGAPDEVVLKGVREVTTEGISGNLSVHAADVLQLKEMVHGNTTVKRIKHRLSFTGIGGDLTVRHGGEVNGRHVGGNAALRDVDVVRIASVDAGVAISRVTGVSIDYIGGDCTVKQIEGDVILGQVGGDLAVSAPGPSVTAGKVAGDAFLGGKLQPGGNYHLTAGGDVELQVQGDIQMTVRAGGEIELGSGLRSEMQEDGSSRIRLGEPDGAATLTIEAGGDVRVNRTQQRGRRHIPFDFVGVEQEVGPVIDEVIEEARRVGKTVREDVNRALHDVIEGGINDPAVGSTIRSSLKELLAALRPAGGPFPEGWPPREQATTPSQEEIRMILQMVEDGTITAEEAEALIEAMG